MEQSYNVAGAAFNKKTQVTKTKTIICDKTAV